MKLIVFNDEQKQEHLPVPLGVTRPKLIKTTPHGVPTYTIDNYARRVNAKKGTVVDVRV